MRAVIVLAGVLVVAAGCLSDIVGSYGEQTGSPDQGVAEPDLAQPVEVDMAGLAGDGGSTQSNCIPKTTPATLGQDHNQGLSCVGAGCHDGNTAGAPAWTVSGTVFSALTGGTGVAGVTVEVVDNAGKTLKLVTSPLGNFASEEAVTYPLTVRASGCPSEMIMPDPVQTGGGNCNQAACHGPNNQIYLP